jgi:hypothetical protein
VSFAGVGRRREGIDWPVLAAIGGLAALIVALDIVTGGDVSAMIAPLLVLGVLALIWAVPLRWSLVALLFLGLTLEAPYEAFAGYLYRTPWHAAGWALLGNLNLVTHVSALRFSGFDVLMATLLIVNAVRRARGIDTDTTGNVPLPRPLVAAAIASAAGVLALWAYGLARGGSAENSLWQVQKPLYIPLLAVALHTGIRGSKDLKSLGVGLVLAAVYRSILAWYIHFFVLKPDSVSFATTHSDSVLFAAALLLLVVLWNERLRGGPRWLEIAAVAVILCGMVFNNRRLVWGSLTGGLAVVATISPWTPFKRRIARWLLIAAPAIALYIAAGWNARSALFAPVASIRSMLDNEDSSTLWREYENHSLARNVGNNPLLGSGFGHQYVQYESTADISTFYSQFRYIPHNSVLGLFAFTGALGVAAIWSLLVATVFFAARAYHRAPRPADRAAAMMCIVIVCLYVMQVYGDVGLNQWIGPLTVSPAVVLAGKLAVSTGAWPWPRRAAMPQPVVRPALAAGQTRS